MRLEQSVGLGALQMSHARWARAAGGHSRGEVVTPLPFSSSLQSMLHFLQLHETLAYNPSPAPVRFPLQRCPQRAL